MIIKKTQIPAHKSLWKHKNGNIYEVLMITNLESERPEYPITVVYCNARNFKVWSRPLSEWHRSMTRIEENSRTRYTDLNLPLRSSWIL
jgi:hypothetical protein